MSESHVSPLTASAAEMTHSSIPACEKLVDYLVKRLNRKEIKVKEKTLLVIKVRVLLSAAPLFACSPPSQHVPLSPFQNVARTGRPEFRRNMQQHAAAIKANLRTPRRLFPLPASSALSLLLSLSLTGIVLPYFQSSAGPWTRCGATNHPAACVTLLKWVPGSWGRFFSGSHPCTHFCLPNTGRPGRHL